MSAFGSADTSTTALALEGSAAGLPAKPFSVADLTGTVKRLPQLVVNGLTAAS